MEVGSWSPFVESLLTVVPGDYASRMTVRPAPVSSVIVAVAVVSEVVVVTLSVESIGERTSP